LPPAWRTIPELCENRPGRLGFSKREKNLNWCFSSKCVAPAAQFRNCAPADRQHGTKAPMEVFLAGESTFRAKARQAGVGPAGLCRLASGAILLVHGSGWEEPP